MSACKHQPVVPYTRYGSPIGKESRRLAHGLAVVGLCAIPLVAGAAEQSMDVRDTTLEEVSSKSLQDQVTLLKQRLSDAQAKLTAIGQCHANNRLYVTRNGSAQCWDPVATFYVAPSSPPPPLASPPPPPPPPPACSYGYVWVSPYSWSAGYCAYCPTQAGYSWNGSYCVYNSSGVGDGDGDGDGDGN